MNALGTEDECKTYRQHGIAPGGNLLCVPRADSPETAAQKGSDGATHPKYKR